MRLEVGGNWRQGNILDFVNTVLTVFGLFQHCWKGPRGIPKSVTWWVKYFWRVVQQGQEQRKEDNLSLLSFTMSFLRAVNYWSFVNKSNGRQLNYVIEIELFHATGVNSTNEY